MKYPRRLLQASADDFERRVLRSIELDAPSPAAMAKAASAVGLGAALVGTGATSAAATAAVGTAATGVAKVSGLVVVKFVAAGFLGGLVATGVVVGVDSTLQTLQPSTPALPQPPAAERPPSVTGGGLGPALARGATVSGSSEPEAASECAMPGRSSRAPAMAEVTAAEASPKAGPRAVPAVAAFEPAEEGAAAMALPQAPSRDVSLAEEVALLDRARQALREQRPEAALGQLDEYGRRAPRGALLTEATVLRVEALVQAHRRLDAARLARGVMARAPESRYAARVKRLVPEVMQKP
jgi:hypothetical protein